MADTRRRRKTFARACWRSDFFSRVVATHRGGCRRARHFSEYALIKNRIIVELAWLRKLASIKVRMLCASAQNGGGV